MTILPLVDCAIDTTNFTENAEVFNNTVYVSAYAADAIYQHDGDLYQNFGASVPMAVYDAGVTYLDGDLVYKDSLASKVLHINEVQPKEPANYSSTGQGTDYTSWTTRYARLFPVTADIFTNSFVDTPFDISSDGIFMAHDGTYIVIQSEIAYVKHSYQYPLGTPYDISTVSSTPSHETPDGYSYDQYYITPTGDKMFTWSYYNQAMFVYDLTTNHDISSATNRVQFTLPNSTATNHIYCFDISTNGLHLYASDPWAHTLIEYTMTVAFDHTTLSKTREWVYPTYDYIQGTEWNGLTTIKISSDGTKLVAVNSLSQYARHAMMFTLSTPYNISTIAISQLKDMGYYAYNKACIVPNNLEIFTYYYYYKKFNRFRTAIEFDIKTLVITKDRLDYIEISVAQNKMFMLTGYYSSGVFKSSSRLKDFTTKDNIISNIVSPAYNYSELDNSSIDLKAVIYNDGGSNSAFNPTTYIWQPNGLYVRTHLDISMESETVNVTQFTPLSSPADITGFGLLSVTNENKPFDLKSYTVAQISNYGYYKIRVDKSFDAVVLAHLKCDTFSVVFKNSLDEVIFSLLDQVSDGSIDSRNEHDDEYTTEIIYNMPSGVRTTLDNGFIEVHLYGANIEIGTLFSLLSIDAGYTDLEVDGTIRDYSPYKEGVGGVIDYVPGIAAVQLGVTFFEKTSDFSRSLRRATSLKRKMVAIDASDSYNSAENATKGIFNAMKMVGRMSNVSIKLEKKNGRLSDMAKVTATLLEVS